jgi:hypothetical protein
MRKIRSKHNNLMNYFICNHKDLSKVYVKKSEKFLKEISDKSKKEKLIPMTEEEEYRNAGITKKEINEKS